MVCEGVEYVVTHFACPACGGNLMASPDPILDRMDKMSVFCPWGDCPAQSMNDGVEARDMAEAQRKMKQLLDAESEGSIRQVGGKWAYQRHPDWVDFNVAETKWQLERSAA